MAGEERRFSLRQAAFIAEVEEKGIDRFFFESELRPRESVREFDERDLVFLGICRAHEADLTRTGRRKIYEALRGTYARPTSELVVGVIHIVLDEILGSVTSRSEHVRQAQAAVVENPRVLGGEPVIAGTRIPARSIAAKAERGMTAEEIVRHHPTLTEEKVNLARLWCDLNPKRGRPPAPRPWRGEELRPEEGARTP